MAFHTDFSAILNTLKEIADGPCRRNARRVDEEYAWPSENVQAIKDAGLAGLVVPKEYGGLGYGFLSIAKACEVLGASCASTSMCYGVHLVGAAVISAKATKYQQEKYLKPIVEGHHWTTLSLSEPGTGSHFYIPQTVINNQDNFLTIEGEKSFVTNGGQADSYVLSGVVPRNDHSLGEFSCVIVPKDSPGMSWGQPWHGTGMRGNSSKSVRLDGVKVPAENLLGNFGDQIWYVFEVVAPYFLIAMSGTYLGIATEALNKAKNHLQKRQYSHSGDALGANPVLQHRLGVLWGEVERTRQLIYSAAEKGDAADPTAILSIMAAKAEVADCVVNVVNEAMTIMGGEAYGYSSDMNRHLRDARAAHVMAPTTDILRTWIGRGLLDLPLLGD